MNVVVIRGRLSSEPVPRTLASGSELLSLEITTPTDQGQLTVPVAWFDPPPGCALASGDEVVVRGVVKRRFFRSAAGTQSRTELVATEVVGSSNRRMVTRLVQRAVTALSATASATASETTAQAAE